MVKDKAHYMMLNKVSNLRHLTRSVPPGVRTVVSGAMRRGQVQSMRLPLPRLQSYLQVGPLCTWLLLLCLVPVKIYFFCFLALFIFDFVDTLCNACPLS